MKTAAWLMSSPHKYPRIPKIGIIKKTLAIRKSKPNVLKKKEILAFPSPFMILRSVLFVYRNGHIHARVMMNRPAS